MGLYDKSSLNLLCQQVMRDNPGVSGLSASTVMVLNGPFTSGLGTSGRNARVTLNGLTGAGFVGKKEFFYDRLNIGSIFNGITVVFDAAGSSKTYADLLPALNAQYGLALAASDLANGTTKLPYGYTPTTVTLNIATTSPAYVGKLDVTWTRKPVGVFPESGPGTKVLLIGDLNEGYFGVVQESELLNSGQLLSKLNEGQTTPAGSLTVAPAGSLWYKFARDGKILYLASYNHITIRWQELYVRGSAYETDQPADKQFPSDGVVVAQKMAVRKSENGRDWYLSPCMPRLSSTFPWDYTSANTTPDPTGDVARLFAKIVASGGFATGEWDGQSIQTGGFWFSTTSQADPTKAYGSSMTGINQGVYDKATYAGAYRPMLELINLDKVAVPLENFIGEPAGVLRKPLFSIEPDTGDVLLTLDDVTWEVLGALRSPLVRQVPEPPRAPATFYWDRLLKLPVSELTSEPPSRVRQVSWQRLLRSPVVTITSEYKLVVPVNLSTANGELQGFK